MKVISLHVYPVKGLRGIPLQTATLGPQGVRHDRCFMLMTTYRNKAGSMHKMQLAAFPECALFSQKIIGEDVVVEYHPPEKGASGGAGAAANGAATATPKSTAHGATMSLHAPPPLHIPLVPAPSDLSPMDVDLHGSPAHGYRMGAAYDGWFSECFGFDVTLVYIGDGQRRVLGPSMRPPPKKSVLIRKRWNALVGQARPPVLLAAVTLGWLSLLASYLAAGWVATVAMLGLGVGALAQFLLLGESPEPWITFTDCAPFLVTSEASRKNVNGRLSAGADVPMYKFRPNIVVDGEDEWSEDFWAKLVVEGRKASKTSQSKEANGNGAATATTTTSPFNLLLTSNCARCTSLNVDYGTGKPAAGEMGEVLKRLSKDRRVDKGVKYSPVFGRYAFLDGESEVEIAVGDSVAVARRNKERTTWDWPGL